MEFKLILLGIMIFTLGFFSYALIGSGIEKPFGIEISGNSNAPSDFLKESQIEVLNDRIIILVKGASLSSYAPTGSMKPLLDENANGIRVVPIAENEIKIGDIISFESSNGLIVHRVVEKGEDSEGVYFVTKGDSNSVSDGKIRFKNIKYKTVGVLW